MPFQKGTSGNPAGRPKGVPDRRRALKELLEPEAPKLIQKAVKMALDGDTTMMRACLDELIPNARPSTKVTLPEAQGISELGFAILELMGRGEMTLEEGRGVADVLVLQARLQEHDDLLARVEALEEGRSDA